LNKFEFALRKFKEWIIASKLEKNYTKEEILSMYLNKFDFLNNAVGINSAAQVYFNKLPKELDLHESAMLIGMAKNPSLFNPIKKTRYCS
jgi:penicillin-binding protein 1A